MYTHICSFPNSFQYLFTKKKKKKKPKDFFSKLKFAHNILDIKLFRNGGGMLEEESANGVQLWLELS